MRPGLVPVKALARLCKEISEGFLALGRGLIRLCIGARFLRQPLQGLSCPDHLRREPLCRVRIFDGRPLAPPRGIGDTKSNPSLLALRRDLQRLLVVVCGLVVLPLA